MNWLEIFGWAGSVFVVVSLMLANKIKFRVLNLIGCIIATSYNLVLGIWPYTAMNAAISLINIYWLFRIKREAAQAAQAASVIEAPDSSATGTAAI